MTSQEHIRNSQTLQGKPLRNDVTGQRFGRLVVLRCYRDKKGSYVRTYATCLCDCGQTCDKIASDLQQGVTRSCGCLRREVQASRWDDLTGQVFGKLRVLAIVDRGKQRLANCLCECGKEARIKTKSLLQGRTKSCGCLKAVHDLSGQTFGRLFVLETSRREGKTWALCQCVCGNLHETHAAHLQSGSTRSCGCYAEEVQRQIEKDLTGQRFGSLVVLDMEREREKTYATCQCDCGTICKKSATQIQKKRWAGTHCGCQVKPPKYPHFFLNKIEMKCCAGCKRLTPLTEFATDKRARDGKTTLCSRCNTAKTTQWQQSHPEQSRANMAFVHARRRTRKRELPFTLTKDEWAFALEYWGHACAVCREPEGLFTALALDHFIALSDPACPGTTATNAVPLCDGLMACNTRKHAKDPLRFLTEKLGPRRAKAKLREIEAYFTLVKERTPLCPASSPFS